MKSTVSDKKFELEDTPNANAKRINEKKRPKNNKATVAMKQTFDFIDLFGKLLGWTCNAEWNNNPMHFAYVVFAFFTWTQIIYSQVMHFMDGEYERVFEVFAIYGTAGSCVLKIRLFMKYNQEIKALHNFSLKITRQTDGQMAEKIEKQQWQNLKLCKFVAIILLVAVSLFGFNPTKKLIYNHELVQFLPIEMMFINQSTISGYMIANALMAAMGVYAMTCTTFIVCHFCTAVLNHSIQVDLIEVDILELDSFWRDSKMTLHDRHRFQRNIARKCQDMDNYIIEIKKIFDQTNFLYFCGAYTAQVICMYEIEMRDFLPGYGVVCGAFLEMLFYCLIGTKAEKNNERLCSVLTQSHWYTYDIHSQKIFLNLLNSCMNSNELWIGPLAPLSVITGIKIVKSIYTYYAFLTEAAAK